MQRDADDVGVVVGPHLTVTCDSDGLADGEEPKIFDGSEWAEVVFGTRMVLKNFHAALAENYVRGLMNFKAVFCRDHLGQLRPLIRGSYPITRRGGTDFL